MKTPPQTLALVTCLVLAGCASTAPVSGPTRAGDLLKSDTMHRLVVRAKMDAKCRTVDSIQTQIIVEHPVGWTGETVGCKAHGCVEERWEAHLCGQVIPYRVLFTPDGEGGAYFSIGGPLKQ